MAGIPTESLASDRLGRGSIESDVLDRPGLDRDGSAGSVRHGDAESLEGLILAVAVALATVAVVLLVVVVAIG